MIPFLTALAPFAPIIGGAIGAVGSLLAPKPKPTTQTNSIDLKKLRADAEAAGFNPLTIIRGGGLAGYGSSTMSAMPDTRIADAFRTFGSGFAQFQYDPYGEQRAQLEMAEARARIASYAKSSAPSGLSFGTPTSKGVQSSPDLSFMSLPWKTDKGTSPAQAIQDRYGDLVEWIYGMGVLGADTLKNLGVRTDKIGAQLAKVPDNFASGSISFAKYLDERRARVLAGKVGGGF